MQRGAQENLWPKFFFESAPIARHFVWASGLHQACHFKLLIGKYFAKQCCSPASTNFFPRERFTPEMSRFSGASAGRRTSLGQLRL